MANAQLVGVDPCHSSRSALFAYQERRKKIPVFLPAKTVRLDFLVLAKELIAVLLVALGHIKKWPLRRGVLIVPLVLLLLKHQECAHQCRTAKMSCHHV